MVILQFNKIIRNKWIWGAFAIAISAFFAFDDVLLKNTRGGEISSADAGLLAGEAISHDKFNLAIDDAQLLDFSSDDSKSEEARNDDAWQKLAARKVAQSMGLCGNSEIARSLTLDDPMLKFYGAEFNLDYYKMAINYKRTSVERFEAAYTRSAPETALKRYVVGSASWASPMEVEQGCRDLTDKITAKVARFLSIPEDVVDPDDTQLEDWYKKNIAEFELPERVKIRYVKFDGNDEAVNAKMSVSEDSVRDYYESVSGTRYTSKDTNGVETVKAYDEVKGELEKELKKIAAIQYFETNLVSRVYDGNETAAASKVEIIAAADQKSVEISDWFTTEPGAYKAGFMKSASSILPGAREFEARVAELGINDEYARYAIVSSDNNVWLLEKCEVSEKHTPSFADAKSVIAPRVKRELTEEKFKARIDGIVKQDVAKVFEVAPAEEVSFARCEIDKATFDDKYVIAGTASKLAVGEVSEAIKVSSDKLIVVQCTKREDGDIKNVVETTARIRESGSMGASAKVVNEWSKWNLKQAGLEVAH